MRKLLIGSLALAAIGLGAPTAFAAEKRVPAYTPPPPPVPVYTWSGCYVGGSAGTNSGRSDGFTTTPGSTSLGISPIVPGGNIALASGVPVTNSFNLSGFIGGFQGGCNWQAGAWVLGIEGDGSATNKSGQAGNAITSISTSAGVLGFGASNVELQERWLVTARGRLGLAGWWGDRTMIYVTGGAAWAKIDSSAWASPVQPDQYQSVTSSPIGEAAGPWAAASNTRWAMAGRSRASTSMSISATGIRSPIARTSAQGAQAQVFTT
jgi:outer membrane immunogenic protein